MELLSLHLVSAGVISGNRLRETKATWQPEARCFYRRVVNVFYVHGCTWASVQLHMCLRGLIAGNLCNAERHKVSERPTEEGVRCTEQCKKPPQMEGGGMKGEKRRTRRRGGAGESFGCGDLCLLVAWWAANCRWNLRLSSVWLLSGEAQWCPEFEPELAAASYCTAKCIWNQKRF